MAFQIIFTESLDSWFYYTDIMIKLLKECWIWGSHSGAYEKYHLMGRNTVQFGRRSPTFLRNILPPSSGLKSTIFRISRPASCLFIAWLSLQPEDGGSTFLRNFSGLLSNDNALHTGLEDNSWKEDCYRRCTNYGKFQSCGFSCMDQ
jgi:hypothetical protein